MVGGGWQVIAQAGRRKTRRARRNMGRVVKQEKDREGMACGRRLNWGDCSCCLLDSGLLCNVGVRKSFISVVWRARGMRGRGALAIILMRKLGRKGMRKVRFAALACIGKLICLILITRLL